MGFVAPARKAIPPHFGAVNHAIHAASTNNASKGRAVAAAIFHRPPLRDAPLDCLAGATALASRFHSWRGLSGKRYICSVFRVHHAEHLGGLPEFESAIALAVSRDPRGWRQQIGVFDASWRDGRFAGDANDVADALRRGAREWHIHLLAEDSDERRAIIDDISL